MPHVEVLRSGPSTYRVTVEERRSRSEHEVVATASTVARYGGSAAAEALLRASFEFLLEREPKESILRRFELSEIEHYFPEYPDEIRARLGADRRG